MSFWKLVVLAASFCSVSAVDPLVDLGYSKYEGVALPNGVTQWLGLRYGAPPIGNLRFAAPKEPLHNSTLQSADQVRLRYRPTNMIFQALNAFKDNKNTRFLLNVTLVWQHLPRDGATRQCNRLRRRLSVLEYLCTI